MTITDKPRNMTGWFSFRKDLRKRPKADRELSLSSERGVALIVVLVLSAVSLALITALLYMITVGTQSSGMHKRYRTALEAAVAGSDIMFQIIDQRDNASITSLLTGSWQSAGFNVSNHISSSCTGTAFVTGSGELVTGAAAKNMTSGSTWSDYCGSKKLIADENNYDYTFQLSTSPRFNVFTKIVDVREGNTGTAGGGNSKNHKLVLNPVVGSGSGEIATPSIPYLYEIEVDAESSVNSGERAKLSVLYQY